MEQDISENDLEVLTEECKNDVDKWFKNLSLTDKHKLSHKMLLYLEHKRSYYAQRISLRKMTI